MNRVQVLHILRIPVLVALLWPLASINLETLRFAARLDVTGVVTSGVWPGVVLASLAFVIVAAVDRHRRHAPRVLAAEGLIAGMLAMAPPFAWVQWFGFTALPGTSPTPVIAAAEGLLHPFAIMWFGVVIITAARQWHLHHERSNAGERTKTQ